MRAHLCGVPESSCEGSALQVNKGVRKAHASPQDAFKCHRRYLLRQGYEMIGPRELRPPDGGPIRVLTKPSRFGASLRGGKRGTETKTGKRMTHNNGDRCEGNIVST